MDHRQTGGQQGPATTEARRGPGIAQRPEDKPSFTDGHAGPPGKVAFVFSGGGSLGCIQVGVLEALLQHGLYPDLIVGTSVGALNGGWLARHPCPEGIPRLKEIWASLKASSIFTGGRRRAFLRLLLGRDHLYADKGLVDLMTGAGGNIAFTDLSIPLYVTATNLDTGQLEVFHEGPLIPAILASTAIPGVFPLVTINGHTYCDGGILSNCSIETAWKGGATHIVVIHCPHPAPGNGYGVLGPVSRALWVSLERLCRLEIERFQARCPVLLVAPEVGLGSNGNKDFSRTVELMGLAKGWTDTFLAREGQGFLRSLVPARAASVTPTGRLELTNFMSDAGGKMTG